MCSIVIVYPIHIETLNNMHIMSDTWIKIYITKIGERAYNSHQKALRWLPISYSQTHLTSKKKTVIMAAYLVYSRILYPKIVHDVLAMDIICCVCSIGIAHFAPLASYNQLQCTMRCDSAHLCYVWPRFLHRIYDILTAINKSALCWICISTVI